eukprot:CAMPEP_0198225134 /NCGR_PEP_ID=MMETSP1445-20131203/99797_1 /TAXON_ID=36898 /ORGANISM="Pyramimonas sp., Strain CCMP2087" /LENGTH=41 /DNA_ID= /DNA_START= /DNA_END= /DNA_ORIENTATION=
MVMQQKVPEDEKQYDQRHTPEDGHSESLWSAHTEDARSPSL